MAAEAPDGAADDMEDDEKEGQTPAVYYSQKALAERSAQRLKKSELIRVPRSVHVRAQQELLPKARPLCASWQTYMHRSLVTPV